jgi:AraC-like DNA-binding protein
MLIVLGTACQPAGHAFERPPGFPHWTLGFVHSGRSLTRSGGGMVENRSRQMGITRPNTPYRLQMPDGGEESWAILDPPPAWAELLAWPETLPGMAVATPTTHAASAEDAFREAVRWWRSGSPRRSALAMNALERCLLLMALDRPGEAWADLHPGVRLALVALSEGPAGKVTVASLARQVGMSPSHLAHTFTAQVGEPPLSWLEGRRIARAQQLLLTTDQPVKRIAQECGFADGEHLARRFRARIGQGPGAWRTRPSTG